jgi:flagellar hook-associated protein 3 FlgL
MQLALGRVDEIRSRTSSDLLAINESSQSLQIKSASENARLAFGEMVSSINNQYLGKNIFGGGEVGVPPLVAAETILADIATEIGATTSVNDLIQGVDNWFDNPTGRFSTFAYQGETAAAQSRNLGSDQSVAIDVRAADNSMRNILKSLALAAIVPDFSLTLPTRDQGALLQKAGVAMLGAAVDAAHLQSTVGFKQEFISTAQARLSSEEASLSILYNEMVSADPFETATRLEAIQTQLETHFTVTGRLSRLSLVDYI